MGKILIYILTEGKGGVEEYVMNLSRFCDNPSSKYGYLVMGEKTVYEDELKALGVDYYYIPLKEKIISNIQTYRRLLEELRSGYDTIYFNTSGLYYPVPYIFAKKYNYKIIIHSHSTSGAFVKKPLHYLNRWWINRACSVRLACSTPAGEWMFGEHEKFTLIPNAIILDRFKFDTNTRATCRAKYGLDKSFIIGNVGRLHKIKNQIFIIEIIRALVDMNIDAKLLLVGDGEMKPIIEEKAKERKVYDRIIFAGETNSPEYFYSAMDSFVMPSFVEGFPITLIEAQANGLPCVVTDTITKEVNVTGKIVFQNLSDSPQIWADAILNNKDRYEKNGLLASKGFDVRDLHRIVTDIID